VSGGGARPRRARHDAGVERGRSVAAPQCWKGYLQMLVLSRRTNEKILLPGINAAVQVVSIKPGVVRLGVEAPPEVAVYREEIYDPATAGTPAGGLLAERDTHQRLRELRHQIRNRLNASTIGLGL